MLIPTRRVGGETLMIGDEVTVTVLGVKGQQAVRRAVRIGVDAPKDVAVDREEIRRRKNAEHPDADPLEP